MIVLGEEQEDQSILHVIIGPETDFHFDLHGHSYLDISNYIHRMPKDKPVVLTINRCNSEENVISELTDNQMRLQVADVMGSLMGQTSDDNETQNNSKKSIKKNKNVRCPDCGRPGSAIIKSGKVYPCETCQKINGELNTKKEIESPSKEELDQIRDDITDEYPQQKKSLSRYKKDKKRAKEDFDDDL